MIPAPAKIALDFIASFEAPRGYDTVYGNKMSRMPKPLTTMTVQEVIDQGAWRTKTFGSSACGRYQFMKATLAGLVSSGACRGSDVMTPDLQDRLGHVLLRRRGYDKFMAGTLSVTAFGSQIAMEWASFPVLSAINGKRRGQSYYAGDGLNHVLVAPEPVERMLAQMRAAAAPAPLPAVSAPRAATVAADVVPTSWWERAFSRKPVAVKTRPGLNDRGSPDLWDVQAALKDRGYYNTGLLDGLDGSKTQAAVAQIRKDNGLGDGGIDADFLAALPGWPHARISTERATMSLPAAAAHAPELFSPSKWLFGAGASLAGVGGVNLSGLTENVQGSFAKANEAFSLIQTATNFISEHKGLLLVVGGLLLLWIGAKSLLSAWLMIRQARA